MHLQKLGSGGDVETRAARCSTGPPGSAPAVPGAVTDEFPAARARRPKDGLIPMGHLQVARQPCQQVVVHRAAVLKLFHPR